VRFGSHSDVQKQFNSMGLKEKVGFVERVGISISDVVVDTYDIKISANSEFVAICRK